MKSTKTLYQIIKEVSSQQKSLGKTIGRINSSVDYANDNIKDVSSDLTKTNIALISQPPSVVGLTFEPTVGLQFTISEGSVSQGVDQYILKTETVVDISNSSAKPINEIKTAQQRGVGSTGQNVPDVMGNWYVNLDKNGIVATGRYKDGMTIGKVWIPDNGTYSLLLEKDWDGQDPSKGVITTLKDGNMDNTLDSSDMDSDVFKNYLTELPASELQGQITVGSSLKLSNETNSVNITYDRIVFSQSDGKILAEYGKNGAKVGNIKVTPDTLESASYSEGVDGFQIRANGNAEFNDIVARGTIFASSGSFTGDVTADHFTGTSGSIGGWDILSNQISGNDAHLLSSGAIYLGTKFQVETDGTMRATDGIFNGIITADSGGSIGGWDITSTTIQKHDISTAIGMDSTNKRFYVFAPTGSIIADPVNGLRIGEDVFWGSYNFGVNMAGGLTATSANITGNINANNGYFSGQIVATSGGNIGGFTITTTKLSGNNVVLDSSAQRITLGSSNNIIILDADDLNYRLWAGNTDPTVANFSIRTNGSITALGANITGAITANEGYIGGWVIDASTLSTTNVTLDSTNQRITLGSDSSVVVLDADDADYRLWVGGITGALSPFSVTKLGEINSVLGSIGGWDILSDQISGVNAHLMASGAMYLGSNFRVESDGDLIASKGNIGGWTIDASTLKSASNNITLDNSNNEIRVGGLTLDGDISAIGTSDYQSEVKGWRIDKDYAEFNNIRARGEFHTSVFVKDEVHITNGKMMVANASILASDLSDSATTAIFRQNVFSSGDILVANQGGSLEYIKVNGSPTVSGDNYAYTVVRDLDGTGANNWNSGIAFASEGNTGQGFVMLDATSNYSPFIDVVTRNSSTWDDKSTKVRMGNLTGITDPTFGNLTGYGLYSDNIYLTGKINVQSGGKIANILINDTSMQTDNFDATNGWQLQSGGSAIFRNGTFTGTIDATTGSIGGWDILSNQISGNDAHLLSSGAIYLGTKFQVETDGTMRATGAIINGEITATALTINPGVTIPSGNIGFNFAGSNSQGGNALDTEYVNGESSANVKNNAANGASAYGVVNINSGNWSSAYNTVTVSGDVWDDIRSAVQQSAYAICNPSNNQLTRIDSAGIEVSTSGTNSAVMLNSQGLVFRNTSTGNIKMLLSGDTGDAYFSGDVYADAGYFRGGVTSTSGEIGGWNILSDRLSGGLTQLFQSGSMYVGNNFNVEQTGILTAKNIILSGGTITAPTISGGFAHFESDSGKYMELNPATARGWAYWNDDTWGAYPTIAKIGIASETDTSIMTIGNSHTYRHAAWFRGSGDLTVLGGEGNTMQSVVEIGQYDTSSGAGQAALGIYNQSHGFAVSLYSISGASMLVTPSEADFATQSGILVNGAIGYYQNKLGMNQWYGSTGGWLNFAMVGSGNTFTTSPPLGRMVFDTNDFSRLRIYDNASNGWSYLPRKKFGTFTGDGVAKEIICGFKPTYVKIYTTTPALAGQEQAGEWMEGQAADSAFTHTSGNTVYSHGVLTSNAILPTQSGVIFGTNFSFINGEYGAIYRYLIEG